MPTVLRRLIDSSRAAHFDELLERPSRARRPRRTGRRSRGTPATLAGATLTRAQARVARQIHENGVTYNVLRGRDGPARPWTLDVLPLILPADEWDAARARAAAAGAAARTRSRPISTASSGC